MNFRKFLKQWLGYSRRERTGSMVLIVILVVVLGVRMLRERSAGRLEAEALPVLANGDSTPGDSVPAENVNAAHAGVDPRLGLDKGQGQSKYSRGGKSHSAAAGNRNGQDGMAHALPGQDNHKAYLKSNQETPSNDTGRSSRTNTGWSPAVIDSPVAELIDLNRADSAQLEALPGIGPVLSVRIIKYRYLLGYYYTPDQLKDVYGLDEEVIEMNRHRFICDTGLIRKIYINSASYRDLLRHPYIEERQVEAIISHRQLYGPLAGRSDLITNRIFTPEEMSRLKPYLVFR
ncbi:MAG: ComEA family DNA-binding protein [Bacteroidota bacterium]